ncbi:response regulator transcription factor [Facilibium subflavum]|uniref:response regulator transcription factor n=1 Tax=Facilibium subflavum TaxID=2219058 RepID=UPI000E65C360|nr:response regulator transcription factor [Facilibium subflavum]
MEYIYNIQTEAILHGRAMGELNKFNFSQYDALLVGAILPYDNGIEVCKKIRNFSNIPILILFEPDKVIAHIQSNQEGTLSNDEALLTYKLQALQSKADDVLPVDIPLSELYTRMKNIIARATGINYSSKIKHKRYCFNIANQGEVFFDAVKMELTSKHGLHAFLSTGEADLLVAFLDFPNKLLTREFLSETLKLGGYGGYEDRSIDVRVASLRRKLLDVEHVLIRTIRGKGYLFNAEVDIVNK